MPFERHMDKRLSPNSTNGNGWLTTFNDMITLLMVFFVLLFTMGSLDVKRFKHFQNALQSAMGVLHEGRHAPVGTISDHSSMTQDQTQQSVPGRPSKDNERMNALSQVQGLEAEITPRGIQLTLNDRLLFDSGEARLKNNGKVLLGRVAKIIGPFRRNIRVEGHTDNIPIATSRYPSNWELSIARAIVVVNHLIESGKIAPNRFSAAGYGDSKPRTVNDTDAGRAKNRRVEIILGPAAAAASNAYGSDPERRN